MPLYNDLRPQSDYNQKDYALIFPEMLITEKKRAIKNLLALRKGLDDDIPLKRVDKNIIIGSWNIKEFGHTTQRLPEAYFYIAEILNRFDLVAIQEIKSHLYDLNIIMNLLGDNWAYMVNDITEGSKGNSERSAYLFNKKRVQLTGVAGEIVLSEKITESSNIKQLKRTPFITGFKAGWKLFSLINLHLHPGEGSGNIEYRKKEVELLLAAIGEKLSKQHFWNENLIIVGDMNLYYGANKDDPTVQLFYDAGFKEVENLIGVDTSVSLSVNEAYDRMFLSDNNYFKIVKDENGKEIGDVFNPFNYVYKDGQKQTYKKYMKKHYGGTAKNLDDPVDLASYYKHPWRKNQLSDHFPIWIELIIDSSDDFLETKLSEF
jgi:endonuclease/exonuclease/phosphatase family metal-dependent hydrolase